MIFDEELRECLSSLSLPEVRRRYEDIEPAFYKTYEWLFDHEIGFRDWLEGRNLSSIFWISGKPGSGKSTIMKSAVVHPLTRELLMKYDDNYWIIAAHFFRDRGTILQKSARGFLQHIVGHILGRRKELFALIQPIFADFLETVRPPLVGYSDHWRLQDLEEALTRIARNTTTAVNLCLFIDALDEHNGDRQELISIITRLTLMTENPLFRIRLVLAGRPENAFRSAFGSCPGFIIHERTVDDVRRYTEERLQT